MGNRIRLVATAAAVVPLALLAACSSSNSSTPPSSSSSPAAAAGAGSSGNNISETGSTLLLPLVSSWQVAYSALYPKILITTSGTGSGTGIADAAAGTVNIGGSDAYLSPADLSQFPGLENIPLAVAAAMVNYNLPGIKKPLNLNGTVLAQIYSGKITTWNNSAIAALNKGVSLPSTKIVPLHRADSSGTTFLFTSYLNAQDAERVDRGQRWDDRDLADGAGSHGGNRQRRHGQGLRGDQGLHRLYRRQLPEGDHGRRARHGIVGQQERAVRAAHHLDDFRRAGDLRQQDAGDRAPSRSSTARSATRSSTTSTRS